MHAARDEILSNLSTIRAGIERSANRAARDPADVLLVAAAKTLPASQIQWVVEAGVVAIGQNYVKELRAVRDRIEGVEWHFIGTLQTNTAHHVAALADVVETVAAINATERLARRAAQADRMVEVLIEVDLTGGRTGVAPEGLPAFAGRVSSMEGVRLRGLMTLPPIPAVAEDSRQWFRRLRELRDHLREVHSDVVELSMGMSLDYEVAVEEGATMVRIGTALFGPRTT